MGHWCCAAQSGGVAALLPPGLPCCQHPRDSLRYHLVLLEDEPPKRSPLPAICLSLAQAPDDSFSDLIAPTQRDAAATRRASIEFRNRPANVRPEVTRKGLTLCGLRRLRKHIEQLVTDGWFRWVP